MEEWKIYRLGDLVDFQNGYAFKSSKFLYDGKYKIIRIKELKNGLVKFFEDTVSISDEPNEILSGQQGGCYIRINRRSSK